MRRAYLLILLPATIVGLCYFAIFHSLGMQVHPAPFLGAAGGFVVAVFAVHHYQSRKPRRPGS